VGLARVPRRHVGRHGVAAPGEQVQELVVEAAPLQRRGEHGPRRRVVSVASTDHCSMSWRCTCFTRARRFCTGDTSSPARSSHAPVSSWSASLSHSSEVWVLDDEQQLVVRLGVRERGLRREQLVQVQVPPVGQVIGHGPDPRCPGAPAATPVSRGAPA
jgi:hypothetical protein